jgi:hypothetical protein
LEKGKGMSAAKTQTSVLVNRNRINALAHSPEKFCHSINDLASFEGNFSDQYARAREGC